jgi:hypothetical protein
MTDESTLLLMEKFKEDNRRQHEETMAIMERKIIAEKENADAVTKQTIEMKRANDIEIEKVKTLDELIKVSNSIVVDIGNLMSIYNRVYEERMKDEKMTLNAIEGLYKFIKDIIYPLLIDLVKNINPDKLNDIKHEHERLTGILADIVKSSQANNIHVTGSSMERNTKIDGLKTETFNYAEKNING